jgi:carbamoyltransferase
MRILGLSAFHRNSAAALVVDGKVVHAIEEERFTRMVGDPKFPVRAIQFCLSESGCSIDDIDQLVFYQKPLRRFERTLASHVGSFPSSAKNFAKDMFLWLGDRLWLKGRIASEIGAPLDRIAFSSHHQSHAAAAFLPSPFEEAAVLVVDGAGEWAVTTLWRGSKDGLEPIGQIDFPHSLALFYSAITQYLGFEPEKDEEKVEALAAFGRPNYAKTLRELVQLDPGGSISIAQEAFRFRYDNELLFGDQLVDRLGPVRIPGGPLELVGDDRRFADIAASAQLVVEEALLHLAAHAKERLGTENLCVGGTLSFNAHAMARLHAEGPFENLFIEPLGHDAGAAVGAALFAAASHGEARQKGMDIGLGDGVRLIPEENKELRTFASPGELEQHLARALDAGRLVGFVQGRHAWSASGLGRRSLFADPRHTESRAAMNGRVVRRDDFLPLCASVTRESAATFFDVPDGADEALRRGQLVVPLREGVDLAGICHEDGMARVHVVDHVAEPELHRLLVAFGERSGLPVLAQADLAARGEPPVRGALEAIRLFERTNLDLLVLEDHFLERTVSDQLVG